MAERAAIFSPPLKAVRAPQNHGALFTIKKGSKPHSRGTIVSEALKVFTLLRRVQGRPSLG